MEEHGCAPIGLKQLLDSSDLNNARFWYRSKDFFQSGCLCADPTFAIGSIEKRIEQLEKFYPVVQGAKAFGVMVHETSSMRGLHIMGDDESLAELWSLVAAPDCSGSLHRMIDIHKRAMFWVPMVPHTVYIPYLDFDEKVLNPADFDRVLAERVIPAINLIHRAIAMATGQENVKWQMFYNTRLLTTGLTKLSFHVHFYETGIVNINLFKLLLGNMSDLPRKLNWVHRNGLWTFEEDLKPLVDTAVYSGKKQLFRGPYCGKEGDSSAIMKPVTVETFANRPNAYYLKDDMSLDRKSFILRARIAASPRYLKMVDFVDHVPAHLAPLPPVTPTSSHSDDNRVFYEFFHPLLFGTIIPAWQQYRFNDLLHQTTGGGATVPTTNLKILKNEPHPTKIGVRHLVVEGDTYCIMDSNHFHSKSRSPVNIGIILDLVLCTIKQSCFACGRPSAEYCFLHLNNDIRIEPKERCKFSCLQHFEPLRDAHQFLLDYFADLFRYHRITEGVWVYDETSRTWKSGPRGTRVVGELIDRVNKRYNTYLNQKKQMVVQTQLQLYERTNPNATQDEIEGFVVKTYEDARKFIQQHLNLVRVSADTRGKMLQELKQYQIRHEITNFNPNPFLLPLRNLQCLNVFTLETEEIRPNHFFTGTLNAELLPEDHADMKDVEHWFWEVATGSEEKASYLKLIAGYMMTMSVHDRKLYVLKGSGKNGKGLFKQFLLDILEGPEGSEPRWKSLPQKYWDKKAGASENPESASPEALKMLHKSILYTDDMDRCLIDACKVKRIVAGEPQSCRGLYGDPIQFRPTAKILWTTNFVPDGPGNDSAWWDRFIMIIFSTKYTDNPTRVNEAEFVFAMNDVVYRNLLTKKDAFFSLAIRRLHQYYKKFPFNHETNEPSFLGSFDIPLSVEIANREARETQLPLASFIREYTAPATHPLQYVTIPTLFHNYILFLENINERKMKQETTQTSFVRLLNTALDITVSSSHVELKLVRPVVAMKDTVTQVTSGVDFDSLAMNRFGQ